MRTKSVVLISLTLLSTWTVSAFGQLPPEARAGLWRAQWITSPSAPQRDAVVLHFRKAIDLPQPPQRFMVQVSADSRFILEVNQKEVGRGPARGDLEHWRYSTFDLAPFLHPGHNEIAATTWTYGTTTAAQISERAAFLLRGETDAENIADTNNTWEVAEEKGILFLPPPSEFQRTYFVAEPPARIDGASFDWSWNDANASRGKWEKPIAIGYAALRGAVLQNNNWQLVPDLLPEMPMDPTPAGRLVRATGVQPPADFPGSGLDIPTNATVSLLLDETHLTTAYPELIVSGGARSTVRLTYAEALVDENEEKGNRNEIAGKHIVGVYDEFLPDGDKSRRFMPLPWRTWRYLQVDIKTADQPLHIDNLRSWFTAFPFEERAHFQSDDLSLNPIWQIGWRTARLDAHDTYMDTPYYERLQYIGDTRIQALISYSVAGDDRLARQAIQAFNDSRISDGITRSRYPTSLTQIIPTFSLLWVGMIHDFWRYRGDQEFVKQQLAGTRTVLDWFMRKQRPDGLMDHLPWWPFVDWGKDFSFGMPPGEAEGGSSPVTLQYIEALRDAAEIEAALGDPLRAQVYRTAENRAVNAIRKLCWNDTYGLIADSPAQKHFSQHSNILGIWLDVIPREEQKAVLSKVLSVSDPGFTTSGQVPEMTKATYYFRFYLARALDHAGMGDDYLRLLNPWREMVSLGLTTWAEQPEPTRSDAHAWSAHPNYDFLTIVAGIRPKAPGFSSVSIEPHLGSLRNVNAAMPTPKGTIEVIYSANGSGVSAAINIPRGVSGELVWKGKTIGLHSGRQQLLLP